ncbi:MAG: 30S ribosome-binding factor RbfA [Victivallales bacterium]|nr:30S ribosome-binding factor RbfA [Victivallales bacterium]
MAKDRIPRVNELLQRELGNVFISVVSPSMPKALVTVTRVKTAIDLRDATVFVRVYGKDVNKESVMAFLERSRAQIQSELSRKIILKYTPRLHFRLDESAEQADKVFSIIRELDAEEAEAEADPGHDEEPSGDSSASQPPSDN